MRARLDAHRANPSQRSGLLGVQIALSAIVLGAALLAPPARGTMLAIPLAPSARTVADWTLSAGARIVGGCCRVRPDDIAAMAAAIR